VLFRSQDRKVDIRVDDSKEPLVELRRLLRLQQGYELMDEGENELVQGRTESAVAKYSAAGEFLSDNEEMIFWQAAFLSGAGKFEEAVPLFRKVFAINPNWRTFAPDLVRLGHLRLNDAELGRLMKI
jgi:tetratricopeptide (TPR) repeat protein